MRIFLYLKMHFCNKNKRAQSELKLGVNFSLFLFIRIDFKKVII